MSLFIISFNKMAQSSQDFNRSALTISNNRACYTGQRTTRIPRGLIKIVGINCQSLDLSYNELTSISALKDCNNLQELILDNNKLYDLNTLPSINTLTTISLNNNKIVDIDLALEKISSCCPNVKYVSLLGNPGYPDQLTDPVNNDEADYDRYRLYAIHVLPDSLRFLDFRPVTQIERKDASNRGRFMRTIKLNMPLSSLTSTPFLPLNIPSSYSSTCLPVAIAPTPPGTCSSITRHFKPTTYQDVVLDPNYSPLPTTTRSPSDHKGAYGKCRYRYSGKNSEGNRFIINSDL
ncbi:leucine-rich melanocyte differentiation-associated protein [Microplitis demolitor]|uniref:leucine-rich melanocyte differentiation-associated protein n=1 Tax=Microplitis demolitor TaxID=69319 RepID=UPI0004CCACE5|nr:leucine-rich melanocyte differentiation-associated protein [Microplitis demolitor]